MCGVVGLLGEAVEGRARQMPGGEQAEEGFFVDEAAAGDVQDDAAGAHQGEAAKIEQRGAVFGLGAMQGDDVRPAHQVVKLKALESFEKAADGQATKIIVPSEIQSLAGLAASFKGLLEDEKK